MIRFVWGENKMNKQLEFIKDMSNANGAPGFEDEVNSVVRAYIGDQFSVEEDTMRNLLLYPKNYDESLPTVLIDGHSDEVAFMVQSIDGNGMIRFLALGGWFSQNVGAHKVRIRNSDGQYVTGIISSKPPHFMSASERTQIVEISDMRIDVGTTSYEETVEVYKIEPGAPIVPDVSFEYNNKTDIMIGKAFDNRLGCALVVDTLLALENLDLNVNVVGAITSQEEIGTRGSVITAQTVKPDIAIVFEGTPADDPYRNEYDRQGAVKGGVQIRHRDGSMIANPRYVTKVRAVAKDKQIKFQDAVRLGGGTNGGRIHISHKAVPTVVLGVPTRYAHTHYGISAYEDYTSTLQLAIEVIKEMNVDQISKL